MSFFHVLLRVVLCIGLILDGSGFAAAAMELRMGHSHGTSQAAVHEGMPAEHCDGHAAAADKTQDADARFLSTDAPSHPQAPSCCDPSSCQSACHMSSSPALTVMPLTVDLLQAQGIHLSMRDTDWLPPDRTRLNRPPIH